MLEKKIIAGGGMDMDTDERFVAKNDYRKAVNCRINAVDEDSGGAAENIRANKFIENNNIQQGDICIGAYEDLDNHVVIYFIYSDSGNHGIYRYDPRTESYNTILVSNILNFNKDYLITGINVVGSDEDKFPWGLLYWTDNYNPPRKINLFTAALGGYSVIDEQTIDAIKYPPKKHPMCVGASDGYITDSNITSNQLKGKSWQFKYRWIYDDGEKSSWSPISPIYLNNSFDAFFNSTGNSSNNNNVLPIEFNSGHATVDRIQIAARNTNGLDDFILICDIDKDNLKEKVGTSATTVTPLTTPLIDNTSYNFYFYNDSIYSIIDVVESNKLYNDIPHKAKAQEVVDGNRLVYGNVETGQDGINNADLSFSAVQPATSGLSAFPSVETPIQPDYRAKLKITDTGVCGAKQRYTYGEYQIRFLIDPPTDTGNNCARSYRFSVDDLRIKKIIRKETGWKVIDREINFGVVNIDYTSSMYFSGDTAPNIAQSIASDLNNSPNSCRLKMIDGDLSHVSNHGHVHTGVKSKDWSSSGDYVILTIKLQNGDCYYLDDTAPCELQNSSWSNPWIMDSGWSSSTINEFGSANTSGACAAIQNFSYSVPTLLLLGAAASIYFSVGMGYSQCGNINSSGSFVDLEYSSGLYNGFNVSQSQKSFLETVDANETTDGNNSVDEELCLTPSQQSPVVPSFKTGASHRFGLVYYDRGNRSSSVQLGRTSEIYIPKITDAGSNVGEWHIQWDISHQPPVWATHYQWVYGGNTLTNDFVQFTTDGIYDGIHAVKDDGAGNPSGTYSNNILVDVTNIREYNDANGGSIVTYDWKEGDVLRFVLDSADAPFNDWEFKVIGYVGENGHPNILEANSSGIFQEANSRDFLLLAKETAITTDNQIDVSSSVVPAYAGYTLEIYSPSPRTDNEDVIYYEFGQMGECSELNGARVHLAPTDDSSTYAQDQDFVNSIPARGTFTRGDVYWKMRLSESIKLFTPVESFHYNDNVKSDYWDKGRPNAVLEDFGRTRKFATCLYSEPYIPNTNLNGLNSIFPDVSFTEFERSYNSIQKLHSRDNQLIIFQEDKVSKSMVNRDVIYNVDGTGNVATSTSVLSQAVPFAGNYGICNNPESFASNGNRMYFVDIKRGSVIRLSQDGISPISEYKMKDFFTDKCEKILSGYNPNTYNIYGVFDIKFGEYVVSFEELKDKLQNIVTENETLGFCEYGKRWNSFYTFYPDFMCTSGVNFLSFKDGNLWHHNRGVDSINLEPEYNKWYGTDVTSELTLVSNEAPSNNKIYKAISQESDDAWDVDITTKNGQLTTLVASDFDTRENIHYSQLFNDINSPGGLIEGDRVRDVSALVKLSGIFNKLTRLFAVNINLAPSERSNK